MSQSLWILLGNNSTSSKSKPHLSSGHNLSVKTLLRTTLVVMEEWERERELFTRVGSFEEWGSQEISKWWSRGGRTKRLRQGRAGQTNTKITSRWKNYIKFLTKCKLDYTKASVWFCICVIDCKKKQLSSDQPLPSFALSVISSRRARFCMADDK